MRCMLVVGERNFQRRPLQRKFITLSLHYMVSMSKGESLIENHIMDNNRQGQPPDQTDVAHPTPRECKEGRNVR